MSFDGSRMASRIRRACTCRRSRSGRGRAPRRRRRRGGSSGTARRQPARTAFGHVRRRRKGPGSPPGSPWSPVAGRAGRPAEALEQVADAVLGGACRTGNDFAAHRLREGAGGHGPEQGASPRWATPAAPRPSPRPGPATCGVPQVTPHLQCAGRRRGVGRRTGVLHSGDPCSSRATPASSTTVEPMLRHPAAAELGSPEIEHRAARVARGDDLGIGQAERRPGWGGRAGGQAGTAAGRTAGRSAPIRRRRTGGSGRS